jgi:hypothetical protein
MDEYVTSGRKLQFAVIQDEADSLARGNDHYTAEEVAQATVHTRQDMVLLAAHVHEIPRQVRWRWGE